MPAKTSAIGDAPARLARYNAVRRKLATLSDAKLLALFAGVTEAETLAIRDIIMGPALNPSEGRGEAPVDQIVRAIGRSSESDFSDLNARLARLILLTGDLEGRGYRVFHFNVALKGYVFGATMADLLSAQEVAVLKSPARRLLGWR